MEAAAALEGDGDHQVIAVVQDRTILLVARIAVVLAVAQYLATATSHGLPQALALAQSRKGKS